MSKKTILPRVVNKAGGALLLLLAMNAQAWSTNLDTAKRFLQSGDSSAIQFNSKLPCYPCIASGWIYCLDGKDHQHVDTNQYAPDGLCCKSRSECTKLGEPGWTCSSQYSDPLFALRMCPFKHDVCGVQSEFVFKSTGASLNTQLTFYPSDVCVYTMRTECGVPAFRPSGTLDNLNIMSIDYDDDEVEAVNQTITDSSGTTNIPLPKASETFDGKGKNRLPEESQLMYSKENTNGSVSYFYANGTVVLEEKPKVITFINDAVKDYRIEYPNKTNITYNLDGSQTIQKFVNGVSTTTSIPAPPAPARMLQDESGASSVWGIVFFYLDGRMKELTPSGQTYWNYKYYSSVQNPNRTNSTAMNNTMHLKVRYNSEDGSYIQNWIGVSTKTDPVYMNSTVKDFQKWSTYFKTMTNNPNSLDAITHYPFENSKDGSGNVQITYTNDTARKIYAALPVNPAPTRLASATATLLDDTYTNGTTVRTYRNGTVAVFKDESGVLTFQRYLNQPQYLFEELDYKKYVSGDNAGIDTNIFNSAQYDIDFTNYEWVRYNNFTVRLYNRPLVASDTRFYNMTSIKYEEFFYNGSEFYRVAFNNGTIALYNYGRTKASSSVKLAHSQAVAIGDNNQQGNLYTIPRPYGSRGGLGWKTPSPDGAATQQEFLSPISYGDRVTQFKSYERAPFALAREYIETNLPDGSTSRVIDILSANTWDSKTFKYIYQNWTVPLNKTSSTFDNMTRMLYNETSDHGASFKCNACPTTTSAGGVTYTLTWEYRVFVNESAACFIAKSTSVGGANDYSGIHCNVACSTSFGNGGCTFTQRAQNRWEVPPKRLWKKDNNGVPESTSFSVSGDSTVSHIELFQEVQTIDLSGTPDQPLKQQVKYHKNDTWFEYPKDLASTATEYQKSTQISYTIRYRDNSTKVFYKNRTIANFDTKGRFASYDRAPASYAIVYPTVIYPDASYVIDYTQTNGTIRLVQSPAITSGVGANTTFQIKTALLYQDTFANGTVRAVFKNGTIALYISNGISLVFDRYEVAPPNGIYIDCVRPTGIVMDSFDRPAVDINAANAIQTAAAKVLYDGNWWNNCTNGTRFQYNAKIYDKDESPYQTSTAVLRATGWLFDEVFSNNTRRRFFKNGTRAIYTFNGASQVFSKWEQAPNTYYESCTDKKGVADFANGTPWPWGTGTQWNNCSVGATSWNATLYYPTLTEENSLATRELRTAYYTGPKQDTFTPNGQMKRVFTNGTIALYQFNGLFYAFNRFEKAPTSLYVDCDRFDYGWLTTSYNATSLSSDKATRKLQLAPYITSSSADQTINGIIFTKVLRWTQVRLAGATTCNACRDEIARKAALATNHADYIKASGDYLCELTQASPRQYNCYAEIDSNLGSAVTDSKLYVGYFTSKLDNPKNGANPLTFANNAACIDASITETNGVQAWENSCAAKCQSQGYWLNRGNLFYDFESNPGIVFAQCVLLDPLSGASGNAVSSASVPTCLCSQSADNDLKLAVTPPADTISPDQRQRWRNCTNGTVLIEYEPMTTLAADATQSQLEKFAWSIDKDEIYNNGTRLRTFRNGSVAFLGYDLSVTNVVSPTAYNFSRSIECDDTSDTPLMMMMMVPPLGPPMMMCICNPPSRRVLGANVILKRSYNEASKKRNLQTTYKKDECMYTNQDSSVVNWFDKAFTDRNPSETPAKYWKVKVFDNNTVWWYLKRCDGSPTEANLVDSTACPTGDDTAAKRSTNAYQIDYYETQGTALNTSRLVYYMNGTVARETWSWTASGSANRVQTVNTVIINKGAFTTYALTLRVGSPTVDSVWAQSDDIVEMRAYANKTGGGNLEYYYYKTPEVKYPSITDANNQDYETMKNTGIYTVIQDTCTSPLTGNCRTYLYRNGTSAIFQYNATATPGGGVHVYSFSSYNSAPVALWYYVTETVSYQWNKTTQAVAQPVQYKLDTETIQTLKGYELQFVGNKSTTRYLDNVKESWFKYTLSDFTGANDAEKQGKADGQNSKDCVSAVETKWCAQTAFNYNKLLALTYNKTEKTSAGVYTVYFRNGTVATFNSNITQKSFSKYNTPPTSYFSWFTLNNYADGTKEYIYADFITITRGPVPQDPPPVNSATNFDYNKILNVGLIDSLEYRVNGTRFDNYRNGSQAVFQNGKFQTWLVAPTSMWVWCDKFDETLYTQNVCTNGTTIRVSKEVAPTGNGGTFTDFENYRRATDFLSMQIYNNGSSNVYYRNGSAAVFNSSGFQRWITAPEEFYVMKTVSAPDASTGIITEQFSNGTVRQVLPEASAQDDLTRNVGFDFIDTYPNGTQQVFYRNGSIALFNQNGFASWVKAPTSYFVSWEKVSLPEGDQYTFSNGTVRMVARAIRTDDTELYKRTSFEQFDQHSNGTTVVTYRNGTIAVFSAIGFSYYITPPLQYFYMYTDGSYRFQNLSDNLIIHFNKPLTAQSTLLEKQVGYDFYTLTYYGVKNVTYRNGTIALFQLTANFTDNTVTETMTRYIVAPVSFFVNYADTAVEGGITRRTFDNDTVRDIYPVMTSSNSRYDNATSVQFIDTYGNGTQKRYFRNGTVALYFKGSFLSYEVKPDQIYIDYPTTNFDDGSYELTFFNGTRRWYAPALISTNTARENTTSLWYTDCLPNGICNFVYRNYSVSVYQDGAFLRNTQLQQPSTPTPTPPVIPPTPTPTPSTEGEVYINKTGPRVQAYDPNQGGVKKYKENSQTEISSAAKSGPSEPLCKGRNQIIILADKRINSIVYLSRRNLDEEKDAESRNLQMVVTDNTSPMTTALEVQSVTFTGSVQSTLSMIALLATVVVALMM